MVEICGRSDGSGTCGHAGADRLYDAFRSYVEEEGYGSEFNVIKSGCHGACSCGPSVIIRPGGRHYTEVSPGSVPRIIETHRQRIDAA